MIGDLGKTFLATAKHNVEMMPKMATMITFCIGAPIVGIASGVVNRTIANNRRTMTVCLHRYIM